MPPSSTGSARRWSGALAAFAVGNFRILWIGLFFSTAAMQMDIVLRPWLAFHLSESALAIGSIILARGLPQMVLPLMAGAVVDRFEKRTVLILGQIGLGGLALLNAILMHAGLIRVWHLVAIGLGQGVFLAFNLPVRFAYISRLVGPEHLVNALALNFSALNLNAVLAPVASGMLIAWNSTAGFYVVAALYAAAVVRLLSLPRAEGVPAAGAGIIRHTIAGLRYIARHLHLRLFLWLAFVPIVLGMPFQQFLPVFQDRVLHVEPTRLGLMYTALGVGALAGSIVVAQLAAFPRKGLLQLLAGIAFGVALLFFALSRTYATAIALLMLAGLTSQMYMTLNSVLIVTHTEESMYGRVMGIYLVAWSFMLISTFPLGALVDLIGPQTTFALSGALLALLIGLIGFAHRAHWQGRESRVFVVTGKQVEISRPVP